MADERKVGITKTVMILAAVAALSKTSGRYEV